MLILPTKENYKSGLIAPVGKSWGLTKNIPFPNRYVQMLPEYKNWIFLEEEAVGLKGKWASVFEDSLKPLDLEIGCGNGFFFAQQVASFAERNLLGIELKYKPLVQTVRRIKDRDLTNGKGIRFHAGYIEGLFEAEEINNIYIYFPDPWPKKRQQKNRLLNQDFFAKLHKIQKDLGFVDFKTDSESYFLAVREIVKETPYSVVRESFDLHKSPWAAKNFMTSFEKIFSKKGQPIFYMRLSKDHQ
jgi:tRNA (guanine-N7-)-methyltransferase